MFHLPDFRTVTLLAGLTNGEIAVLYGVSRQTVYDWLHSRVPIEGSPRDRMAYTITKALLNALGNKALPLPAMDTALRREKVAGMAKRLQNLKPVAVK